MKRYAIHAPLNAAPDAGRAIKIGFCKTALFLGPVWLLAHGAWRALLVYVLVAALVWGLSCWLSIDVVLGLVVLVQVYLGFAGLQLLSQAWERAGRPVVDIVSASSVFEAERAYIEHVLREGRAG